MTRYRTTRDVVIDERPHKAGQTLDPKTRESLIPGLLRMRHIEPIPEPPKASKTPKPSEEPDDNGEAQPATPETPPKPKRKRATKKAAK